MHALKNVLSIAGSDPSGGAGIQADLKTFAARGTYGMAVVTTLTAQNTQGVSGVFPVPPEFVAAQIDAVFADICVAAVKIGMIFNAEIAQSIAESLRPYQVKIVLDPVMIAKGGATLLDPAAISMMAEQLLPLATVITPNLPEAAALLNCAVAQTRDMMRIQGEALLAKGSEAVLMKGGHLESNDSPDLLLWRCNGQLRYQWFEGARIVTVNTHGTGCTLSSALAAELAKDVPLNTAVTNAKAYLARAIAAADTLQVGMRDIRGEPLGHGPLHHSIDQQCGSESLSSAQSN